MIIATLFYAHTFTHGQNVVCFYNNVETMGAMGPRSLELVREVGRRIALETGEPRSTDFLLQRLSVAVQRGNCRGHLTYLIFSIMSCAIIIFDL